MKKAIISTVFVITTGLAIYSYPASAACVVAQGNIQSDVHAKLLQKAQSRIESTFGSLRSQPTVYFFDQKKHFWPLKLNQFGSTSFLGYKTCVAIGPQGQNVDVVAHELMHAEIAERVGFWNRATKIPVWFDEGLAMQVDFRKRYDLQAPINTKYVTELFSGKEFFVADSIDLTRNYAAAKSEVNAWLLRNNSKHAYESLSKLKHGASFDSIWQITE